MLKTFTLYKDAKAGYLLVIGLLLLATWPAFALGLGEHSDANIRWLSNFLFAHDFNQLQGWVFSQGPLAFLQFPLPIGNNQLWALVVLGSLRLIILLALFPVDRPIMERALLWKAPLFVLMVQMAGHHQIGLLALMTLIASDQMRPATWKKLLGVVMVVLLWQIRSVPALAGLLLLSVHFLLLGKGRALVLVVLSLPLSDLIVMQDLEYVLQKYWGLWDLFFDRQSLQQTGLISWPFLAVGLLSTGALAFSLRQKSSLAWSLFLIFLLFYYSSRPEAGPALVFLKLSLLSFILFIWLKPIKALGPKLVLAAAILLLLLAKQRLFPASQLQQKWRPLQAWQGSLSPSSQEKELRLALSSLEVHPPQGEKNRQVYPYHYLAFSSTGGKPITGPVPQAYYLFNPRLDAYQAKALASNSDLDQFIIHAEMGAQPEEFWAQNLWHYAPAYLKAVLEHFYLKTAGNDYLFYDKRASKVAWTNIDILNFEPGEEKIIPVKSGFVYRLQSRGEMLGKSIEVNGKSFLLNRSNQIHGFRLWPLQFSPPELGHIRVRLAPGSYALQRIPAHPSVEP